MYGIRFHRRTRTSGLSLIELMIALTVLLVAVLGTVVTQLGSSALVVQSRETNRASADLTAAMEALLILPPDQIPTPGRYPPGQSIAAFDDLHLANERIVPSYPGWAGGTADVPDPLPIVLTLTFQDFKGRQRQMRLASMKTR
jgi:prepilin-type N-terminal cleavage/methylation domain-containing protein